MLIDHRTEQTSSASVLLAKKFELNGVFLCSPDWLTTASTDDDDSDISATKTDVVVMLLFIDKQC